MLSFRLPWPPSVNHYYGHNKSGGIRIKDVGRAYRRYVQLTNLSGKTLTGRLDVRVYAYPPDKRKRDLDNILKALLDALQRAGIYKDDNQIDYLSIERCGVVKKGEVIVHIKEIE